MVWVVLVIRLFIFNPFSVVWQSMEPTIHEWDFILLDKYSTAKATMPMWIQSVVNNQHIWQPDVKRWDIIVFAPPWKTVPYIKRIIWFPWETVKIESWVVSVCPNLSWTDCITLDESYLKTWTETIAACGQSVFPVNSGLFVMWDNRWHSTDSSCCFSFTCLKDSNYTVPNNYIIWKVKLRLFPQYTNY